MLKETLGDLAEPLVALVAIRMRKNGVSPVGCGTLYPGSYNTTDLFNICHLEKVLIASIRLLPLW